MPSRRRLRPSALPARGILCLGDLHNDWGWAEETIQEEVRFRDGRPFGAVVQVGDLTWRGDGRNWRPPVPVHFTDGNHDHLPSLLGHTQPTEVAPNLIYCPRGSVLDLDGRRVAFFGGARSMDRAQRVLGESWWEEEEPTEEEAARLEGAGPVDLLITHTPPESVMRALGYTEGGRASWLVEQAWTAIGRPEMLCGHLHLRYRSGPCTVLGFLDATVL